MGLLNSFAEQRTTPTNFVNDKDRLLNHIRTEWIEKNRFDEQIMQMTLSCLITKLGLRPKPHY